MASITLELPPGMQERIEARSRAADQDPEGFVLGIIEEYLEDLEDIEEAQRVMAEIKAGRMETYSLEEVKARLGLED